jgi:DNA-binding transcriptional regulator YiaG
MSTKERDLEKKFADGLVEVLQQKASSGSLEVPRINPREIRDALEISQQEFATRFSIPLATLRNWEQGRTAPDAPSTLLLYLIGKFPSKIAKEVKKLKESSES